MAWPISPPDRSAISAGAKCADGLRNGSEVLRGPCGICGEGEHVTDLPDVAGDDQGHAPVLQVRGQLAEHAGRGDVDIGHSLEVEHDHTGALVGCDGGHRAADVIGVGEEQAGQGVEHQDAQ
jgi:hypothetical protein